jgi:hypothetical protein
MIANFIGALLGTLVVSQQTISATPTNYIIFVNGYGNTGFARTSVGVGFQSKEIAWNNFGPETDGSDDRKVVDDLANFVNGLPSEQKVAIVSYSFGSITTCKSLEKITREISFAAFVDAVPRTTNRADLVDCKIPKLVNTFYNTWQQKGFPPLGFEGSGQIQCLAQTCKQEEYLPLVPANPDEVKNPGYWHKTFLSDTKFHQRLKDELNAAIR